MIIDAILKASNFLVEQYRGLATTITGTLVGTAAEQAPHQHLFDADKTFQHAVWTITCVVGILTTIGLIQKQIDRRRNRKNKK